MKTKTKAVVGLSKLTPEAKAVKAQSIIDSMQSSGNFPNGDMPIAYATLQTSITGFQNSIVLANNGTSADVSNMHEEEKVLVMTFNLLKAHVEIVSNAFTNPDAIILSAGMTIAVNSGPNSITDLTLEALGQGTVQIRVPRHAGEKAFCYQYAIASDPTNWQNISYSSLSKIEFTNQTPGATLHFRYSAISKTGMGSFSDSKQLIVI
ncbi:MAG: hypothetical protein IAF38_09995 [Bacteroidia bacterium]|nr:hypothetical protein [Bacteroidia bacterium]